MRCSDNFGDSSVSLPANILHLATVTYISSWFCVVGDSVSSRDGNVHSDVHLVTVSHAGVSGSLVSSEN